MTAKSRLREQLLEVRRADAVVAVHGRDGGDDVRAGFMAIGCDPIAWHWIGSRLAGLVPAVGILRETGTLYPDDAEALAGRRLHHHPALEAVHHRGAQLGQARHFGSDIVGLDVYVDPALVIHALDLHDGLVGRGVPYSFGPTPHGGGFDDIVFTGCKAYFSASNPASNPNTGPAIVSATLDGNDLDVKPALLGTAMGIDIPTDKTMKLNLLDPDSMTVDPQGNIVLNSQSDNELIYVSNPGPKQRVLVLPLSYTTSAGTARIDVDDTAFVTSTQGFILFADEKLNKVFALKKNGFVPGQAYTSVSGAAFVGTIDLLTGLISPVVTGITAPGGMAFVDTAPHARGMEQDDAGSVCGQESAYHEGGDQGGDQQGSQP